MVKFVESLTEYSMIVVRFLSNLLQNYHRAVLGQKISYVKKETKSNILTVNSVYQIVKFFKIPEYVEWQILALKELIDVQKRGKTLWNMNMEDINQMINLPCTC